MEAAKARSNGLVPTRHRPQEVLSNITAAFHYYRHDRSQNKSKLFKRLIGVRAKRPRERCQAAVTDYDSGASFTGGHQSSRHRDQENNSNPFAETVKVDKVADQPSRRRKMLLDLPPEILEMILLVLPPDSFAVMLMSCKTIRTAILSTPKVLRTQLLKVPGLRLPDQATIVELLRAFNQRAVLSAFNGFDAFADIVVNRPLMFEYQDELWTRPKFNWIQRCCSKGCDRGVLATAADYCGVIHVYRIRKGRIVPLCKLDPKALDLDEDDSPRIRYRCIAMRWRRCSNSHIDHVVALFSYSIERFTHEGSSTYVNQFVSEAAEKAERTYYLCGWKMCKDTNKPAFGCEVQCPTLFKPIMIATTDDYCNDHTCYPVAIIFKSESMQSALHKISIYQITNSKTVHVPVKATEVDGIEPPGHILPTTVTRARFTTGAHPELWLYGSDTAPIDTVAGCATAGIPSLRFSSSTLTRRSEPTLFTSKASPASFRGMPIRAEHAHECGVYENGNKYCVQTILELVIPRLRVNGAFLVKYAEEQESCSPFDLNSELPPLEYTVVAKLLGSDTPSTSPMKRVIALSPDKEWIAIADWDGVKLWGIHTQAFLKQEEGSLPREPEPVSNGTVLPTYAGKQNKALQREFHALDDKAYTTNCAQGYFHDHIRIKGTAGQRIVGIRPIELPSRGVVYSLAFAKRNILWAWTERGLVKWAWNKKRGGVREEIAFHPVPDNLWGGSRW